MKNNDNSSRLNDVDAVMPATPVSQENEPTPKFTSKKRKLLCVGVLFLLVAALPIPLFLTSFDSYEYLPLRPFYVSRDGVLYDLSALDPWVGRGAVTNSLDLMSYTKDPVLYNSITPSGSFVTSLKPRESERQAVKEYQYEKLSDEELSNYFLFGAPKLERLFSMTDYITYAVETSDPVSEEVLSSEKLLEFDFTDDYASPCCILSEDKLFFCSTVNDKTEFFWCVKSDDQWTKVPLDFGVEEKVYVLRHEIVREKKSILFLLVSASGEPECKHYVSSCNYESFAVEKTIELPSNFCYGSDEINVVCSGIRVLSGAQHFCVYQAVHQEKPETLTLNGIIFATKDLTKVKEITVPDVSSDTFPYLLFNPFVFVISPDLRYVAYGLHDFCLYDLELQQKYHLRSHLPTLYRQAFSDACHKLADSDYMHFHPYYLSIYASIWSAGFSKDSRFLLASDLLGNVYQWDVQNKKRAQKITNSKY
jgi:WD40 repeat protein